MRHNIYSTLLAGTAMLVLAGCENESQFRFTADEGQLNCSSLSVDYINRTRAASVDLGDFTVNFVNTATNETERSFKYSEMPELVALPVGEYRAEAVYGENLVAAWDNPYYTGNSTFKIEAGKITDVVDPIECSLQNIKVVVDVLDDTSLGLLGSDIKVEVKAGESGLLTFDSNTGDKVGYFKYEEGSTTLTAVLSGTIDGTYRTVEPVAYDNVAPGKSYRICFHVNSPDNINPGDIEIGGGITVDPKIEIEDQNVVVDPNEPQTPIEDDMRPVEGEGPGKDPENPDDPGNDPVDPSDKGPEIITQGFKLNEVYIIKADDEGNTLTPVVFTVKSQTGLTGFKINIDSTTLTPEELEGVGLSADLDLINPGELEGQLNGLGFPTGENVKGQTECEFDISGFVPMLMMLGPGEHKFNLTVSDDNGTATGAVFLKNE